MIGHAIGGRYGTTAGLCCLATQERRADGGVTRPGRRRSINRCCISSAMRRGRDEKVLAKVCRARCCRRLSAIARSRRGSSTTPAIPKKGSAFGGRCAAVLGRQLGKQDNCQAAVSLSIANRHASLPVRYRLYLPQEWASRRRAPERKARVPAEIVVQNQTGDRPRSDRAGPARPDLPRGAVLLDAGYGNHTGLRAEIAALGPDLRRRHSVEHFRVGARFSSRCRRSDGLVEDGRRLGRAAAPSTNLSRSRRLPWTCLTRAWRTVGWREARGRLPRALPVPCAPVANGSENGCHRMARRKNRPNIGSRRCPGLAFERLVDLPSCAGASSAISGTQQELGLDHSKGEVARLPHHATLCIAAYNS